MMDICEMPTRDDLQRLILSSLDYSHNSHVRVVLTKLLTTTSKVSSAFLLQHGKGTPCVRAFPALQGPPWFPTEPAIEF